MILIQANQVKMFKMTNMKGTLLSAFFSRFDLFFHLVNVRLNFYQRKLANRDQNYRLIFLLVNSSFVIQVNFPSSEAFTVPVNSVAT